ncbi:MAG: UDP-N-acetylglucosamine 2-epimerase (non-hydrolyzing) [Brumimicrobium sp.]|nr:UDP-N-acetylglucosamine 2-epimerase (non-hydrolyzing) [Brumimicrobium sp.]
MKKILTIIGARPQIIKSAALSRAIQNHFSSQLKEVIVHTGQHYDKEMSSVFFDELGLPQPDYNLNIGSHSHGVQTAQMIEGIEQILQKENPNAVVVYGDTNSTLAASIAASKMQIDVVHIEAGLRSYNKQMPEEINRITCDHVSTLLFSPTKIGVENLQKEGFKLANQSPYSIDNPMVYHCGDIMYDNSLHFSKIAEQKTTIIQQLGLENKHFYLATVHRPANTDDSENLSSIFKAFLQLLKQDGDLSIVLPLHPRTKGCMQSNLSKELLDEIAQEKRLLIIPPVSFLEVIALEKNCSLILTDSGGLQKEAYFFQKPCLILRTETEWLEIVEQGAALIVNADTNKILQGVHELENKQIEFPPLYGDGHAAEFIASEILKHC